MHRILSPVSYLAVWAGLYVTGAVVYLAQLSGLWVGWNITALAVLAYCLLASTGVYLLDRVKLRDAWLDPADNAAHPERYHYIATRSRRVRILAVSLLAIAAAIGWTISPLLVLLIAGACLGVLAYAGKPRRQRARIKDVLVLKNSFVAMGISAFTLVLVAGASLGFSLDGVRSLLAEHTLWPLAFAGATLGVRVFADAVLCDLDDEASDRDHGTATLPTHMGRRRAWAVALGLRLAAAAALCLIPLGPLRPRVVWAVLTVLSSVGLKWWNPPRVRDYVDARLALEALAASVILSL